MLYKSWVQGSDIISHYLTCKCKILFLGFDLLYWLCLATVTKLCLAWTSAAFIVGAPPGWGAFPISSSLTYWAEADCPAWPGAPWARCWIQKVSSMQQITLTTDIWCMKLTPPASICDHKSGSNEGKKEQELHLCLALAVLLFLHLASIVFNWLMLTSTC